MERKTKNLNSNQKGQHGQIKGVNTSKPNSRRNEETRQDKHEVTEEDIIARNATFATIPQKIVEQNLVHIVIPVICTRG